MSGTNSIREKNLNALAENAGVQVVERIQAAEKTGEFTVEVARTGDPTLLFKGQALHSRYDPVREANSLADKLLKNLESDQPVLLIGLGLGYLAESLADRLPANSLTVVEPSAELFSLACDNRDLTTLATRCRLVVGSMEGASPLEGVEFPEKVTPLLLALPSLRQYAPKVLDQVREEVAASRGRIPKRIRILVVGALEGGSVPVGHYVVNALRQLGHKPLLMDNSPFLEARKQLEDLGLLDEHRNTLLNDYTRLLGQGVVAKAIASHAQLVLFMAQSPGTRDALAALREAGIPTAMWFVEDGELFDYALKVAPGYDVFFHIQKGDFGDKLRQAGARHVHYLPLAADPDVHHPVDLSEEEGEYYGSDVSHMGAGYYNRRRFFLGLGDYDFKLWGSDWEQSGLLAKHLQKQGERVTTEEAVKIFNASRINLNLHSSTYTEGVNPNGDFVNPRTFEVAACGGFQLVDERSLLPELFEPGKEIVTFHDLASCREAIDYYLEHPGEARAIANAARERVLRQHTYRHRMEEALRVIAAHVAIPEGAGSRNTVRELVEEAGEDRELAAFFARMGEPEDELTIEGVSSRILQEEGELGETEVLFLLMNEFRTWAKEKGIV